MIRILLVDDSKDFVEPVSFWLTSKGYTVRLAANGREALERIKEERPDLVFLDINMPEMNGLETLRRVRERDTELPVIMLTAAYQNQEYFTQANTLGISGFFPKSNTLPELTQMIETILRAHSKLKTPPRATEE